MALSIGLLGSLHCVGMCGPIALALPLDRSSSWNIFNGNLFYSLGRLSSYFLLGLLFGSLGQGVKLFGLQQALSIGIGVIIIMGVLFHQTHFSLPLPSFYRRWVSYLQLQISKAFKRKSLSNLSAIGFVNGLLPCGLVYMAIAGAVSSTSVIKGGFFMLFFGLGTLPLMWAVGVFGQAIEKKYSYSIRKVIPYFLFILGVLFILRGAELGIPYLSPMMEETNNLNCH